MAKIKLKKGNSVVTVEENLAAELTQVHGYEIIEQLPGATDLDDVVSKLDALDIEGINTQLAQTTHQFVDVTKFIQAPETTINNAFNRAMDYAEEMSFKNLCIPKGTWYVDPTDVSPYSNAGLKPRSNFNIYLSNDCTLESIATDKTNYRILQLQSVENVNIYGGVIKGDRGTHIGTTGEWGCGIYLDNAKNINIYNTNVIDCWGDGITLALGCEKVFLHNVVASNNRRNNLTIISCKSFRGNSCWFDKGNGASPESGLDIEPNDTNSDLEDIKFIDCVFNDNNERGFAVNVIKMADSNKEIDIEFVRPVVKHSTNLGITIKNAKGIKGQIKLIEPIIDSVNGRGLWLMDPVATGAKIIIERPRITNCNLTITGNDPRLDNAILAYCTDNTLTEPLGNVEIIEPYVDSPKSVSCLSFFDNRTTPLPLENVKILNPIKMSASSDDSFASSSYRSSRYWISPLRTGFYLKDVYADNSKLDLATLNYNNYHGISTFWKSNYYYANNPTTMVVGALLIPETVKNEGIEITYENLGVGGMKINFRNAKTELFYPRIVYFENGNVPVKSMETVDINASITLKITDNGLVVSKKIGNWTFTA